MYSVMHSCTISSSANIRILKACESVGKNENKQMAKLWSNDNVYHRKLTFP